MRRKISRDRSLSWPRLTSVEPIGTSWKIGRISRMAPQNCPSGMRNSSHLGSEDRPGSAASSGWRWLWASCIACRNRGEAAFSMSLKIESTPMSRPGRAGFSRPSRRRADELRAVTLERGVVKHAEGSCFVKFGDTHVLVTATLEDRLPPWLKGQARGWVTAEYGMLPRATHSRTRREASAGKQKGRTIEIQRLIGRSLRAVLDLPALGERQITVDCDVIQADGGTRTAAITGAWVALHDCVTWMKSRDMLKGEPLRDHVAG